jgi:hypothetical protein
MSDKTRQGHRFLRTVLAQAAHAAARTKSTYLSAQYRRLATRRGKKRAIMAVAHSMLVMAYYIIQRQEPYREAGGDFFDRLQPEDTARRLVKCLEHLGYHVTLQHPSTDSTLNNGYFHVSVKEVVTLLVKSKCTEERSYIQRVKHGEVGSMPLATRIPLALRVNHCD